MDLTTVINFVSNTPVPPGPTPGGDPTGGLAQTGDFMFIVVAMLLCVFAASVVALRMWKAKRAPIFEGAHAKQSKLFAGANAKSSVIVLSVIGAIMAIIMSFAMVSANSTNALAQNNNSTQNGVITPSKDTINAVVNEATGTVSIEEFYVTNSDAEFFKFNQVTATKDTGIDDGDCNWTVYLSNDQEITSEDKIYVGAASGEAKDLDVTRYIEGKGSAYIRIETDMTPEIAKSLIGKKVLSLSLSYLNQESVNTAFLSSKGGTISSNTQLPVVPNVGKYVIAADDKTKLSVFDGCHWFDYYATADEHFELVNWTADPVGTGGIISEYTKFKANFQPEQITLTYDKNGGSTAAPASETKDYGVITSLANYDGQLSDGTLATGWNTQADGKGLHYDFGDTYTLVASTTLYADWAKPTFKAVWNSNDKTLLYTYDKETYEGDGITTYEFKQDDAPKLMFKVKDDWGAGFNSIRENVETINIDATFKSLKLQMINFMFDGMTKATSVNGLENMNWSTIQYADYMFNNNEELKTITLPEGIFFNLDIYSCEPFGLCYFEQITNEAEMKHSSGGLDFSDLWKGYRSWINKDTGEPIGYQTPLPAGTFVMNKASWNKADFTKVEGVYTYYEGDEEKELTIDLTNASGKALPSWIRDIRFIPVQQVDDKTMLKITGKDCDKKDVEFYENYDATKQAFVVSVGYDNICTQFDFNTTIYTASSTHTITAQWDNAELSDEALYYLVSSGWTKVEDNKYTYVIEHGLNVNAVIWNLPQEGITYKDNNPNTMDEEKTFTTWGADVEYDGSMVIPFDMTFHPQFDYIIQILSVPMSLKDKTTMVSGISMNVMGQESTLPGGGVLAVPANTAVKCSLSGNVLNASLVFSGTRLSVLMTPVLMDSQLEDYYTFVNWNFVDSNGESHVVADGEEFEVQESSKIIANFMPLASQNTASVNLIMPDAVNVTNAPADWSVSGETFTNSNVALNTTYGTLLDQWKNTTYSLSGRLDLKLEGWYLESICYDFNSTENFVTSYQLLKVTDKVYGAFSNLIPKFSYVGQSAATDHATPSVLGNINLPIGLSDALDEGTKVSVGDDNSIYFNMPGLHKPGMADDWTSLDADTTLKIDANVESGYDFVCWNVYTMGEDEPQKLNKNSSIVATRPITKIEPVASNEKVTVKVSLGEGTVTEGWVPADWTKTDDHNYTKQVSVGTTYENVLKQWNLEEQRLTPPSEKVFNSWNLPAGKELTNLVQDNDEITASWTTIVTVPVHSKYPGIIYWEGGMQDIRFPFGRLSDITSEGDSGGSWLTFSMSNGDSERYFAYFDRDLSKISGFRIFYYGTDDSDTLKYIDLARNELLSEKLGGSIQEKVSSFVRFDVLGVIYQGGSERVQYCAEAKFSTSEAEVGTIVKTIDTIDPSLTGTQLVYGNGPIAGFVIDGDNSLTIKDDLTGFHESYKVEFTQQQIEQQAVVTGWKYNGVEIQQGWHNIAEGDTPHQFQAIVQIKNELPVLLQTPQLNDQDNVSGAEVLNNQDAQGKEGTEDAAVAAVLAVPALAALGFRKRLRGKHVKIN